MATIFGLLAVLVIAERYGVLSRYAFRHTDHDQVLMWYASSEFASLRFHEPRFFGQNYSTMIEGALAAPLVALGARHAVALPLITSLLALAPFALVAVQARARSAPVTLLLCAALPLALPLRYHMLSSMPRGLVTGTFFASLAVPFAFGRRRPQGYLALGFLAVFAVSVLPNALLLTLPLAAAAAFAHRREPSFFAWAGLGAGVAAGLHWAAQRFYEAHPAHAFFSDTLARSIASASFSKDLLWPALLAPERFFRDVSPTGFSGPAGLLVLLAGPPVALLFLRRPGPAVAAALSSLLVLASLGSPRVGTGAESVFYPWSRHFLPLPVLILVNVLWVEEALGLAWRRAVHRTATYVLILAYGSWGLWEGTHSLDARLAHEIGVEPPVVFRGSVALLEKQCDDLAGELRDTGTELVIFEWSPGLLLNYGCPAILPGGLRTLCPRYDRRTWVLKEELSRVEKRFLVYGFDRRVARLANDRGLQVSVKDEEPNLFLIEGNRRPLGSVLRAMGISHRAFD